MVNESCILGNKAGFLFFAFILLSGCVTSTPSIDTSPDAQITFDGLYEVQNGVADRVWAKPGLDLSTYSKILVQSAGIEYRPGGATGRSRINRLRDGIFEVTEDQKRRFQKTVSETFLEELEKSTKFTLVNQSGPDVLLIRAALLEVVSFVPPDSAFRTEIYLSSIGEATLVLELRDSITEAVLVRVIDRGAARNSSSGMSQPNRVTNQSDVRHLVRRWMAKLTNRLDEFSGFVNSEKISNKENI